MKNRNEILKELKKKINNTDTDFEESIIYFLSCNNWFDIKYEIIEEEVYIDEKTFYKHYDKYCLFFKYRKETIENKTKILSKMLSEKYILTAKSISDFFETFKIPIRYQYVLYDFFLTYLKKDAFLLTDNDLEDLNIHAYEDLTKINGDIMNYFFRWLKEKCKVNYIKDYYFNKRYSVNTDAYDEEEYLQLLFYLFNEDYISQNDMIQKAIESQDCADTWLFLSMHFISAIRNTDMIRIKHPRLLYPPEEVLKKIKDNTFTDDDARITLSTVISRLNNIPLIPNKTKSYNNISSVKICVPYSIEVLMGTLFALCEAHYQINHTKRPSFIRIVKSYEQISEYMGEDIGGLFINSNFKSRSMNKSYLQSIYALSDDILFDELNNEFRINGYILAALARSHKGSYGSFAQTTVKYIKDAKFSGFSPQFVARELFERGVLSSISSMLLKMLMDDKYNQLPVKKQTLLIKELNLSPREIEKIIDLYNSSRNKAINNIQSLLSLDPIKRREEIINALHRIGNGNAVSKDNDVDCILTAFNKICPFKDRKGGCSSCEYSCGNKSTVYYLAQEFNRLYSLCKNTENQILIDKYKYTINNVLLPTMNELFTCAEELYGHEIVTIFERIIKDTIDE